LFALAGQSTSSGIEFVRGSLRTVASSTPYEIEITQAAEQATIVGTNKLQASVVIDATNDRFSLRLDGQASGDLALTHGTYTRAQLAAHLQEVIRSAAPLGGRSVDVILVDDALQIRSAQYGTASQISALNGTALTALGFAGTESDTGQNVGGHFIVDGLIEAATGAGQMLTGGPDNASTADLAVRVTLSAAQIGAGPEGEISVSRGIAAALDKSLNDLLDPFEGRLKTTADQFDDQVESVDVAIQRLNALFEAQQETLLERFAALESTLSRLQATNNILVNQLAQVTLLNRRV
jgi:flagellar hook-associated protein 2